MDHACFENAFTHASDKPEKTMDWICPPVCLTESHQIHGLSFEFLLSFF